MKPATITIRKESSLAPRSVVKESRDSGVVGRQDMSLMVGAVSSSPSMRGGAPRVC